MSVKELIEELEKVNPDATVIFSTTYNYGGHKCHNMVSSENLPVNVSSDYLEIYDKTLVEIHCGI